MAGLLSLFEPEETIGRGWHRLIGGGASWPRHPQAGVDLSAIKGPLAVYFRGLGGPLGMVVAPAVASNSRHRLSQRLKLALGEEKLDQARRDRNALYLPARIEAFDDRELNHGLYFWLAAFFAHRSMASSRDADPLRRELSFLADARRATKAALAANPGVAPLHASLCGGLRRMRPLRRLPPVEAAVEQAVRALIGDDGDPGRFWPLVCGKADLVDIEAPRNYRPFLPVPLWGEAVNEGAAEASANEDSAPEGGASEAGDERVRKAKRRLGDQMRRKDPLILNRFEKILTLIEALNISRTVDDDDEASARSALGDAEEITLAAHSKRPTTRLRVELDLPAPAASGAALAGEFLYPEWDYAQRAYHPAHCRVIAGVAPEAGENWRPDAAALRRIARVRQQFEALRPRSVIQRGAIDGAELDLEALVRSRADFRANGMGSDRIYCAHRKAERDLSVAFLVDVSLSTDSWIDNRRVLDVEKEAVLTLANGLAACGDDYGIFTFTSKQRSWVKIDALKDFDEPFGATASRRICALKPQFYTRVGAAIRHSVARLQGRPNGHRLLLVLTDAKPNDVDHYEGRYGVEDARRAVQEAHRVGVAVFGITVDRKSRDYFPAIFGRGGYAIVGDPARLPAALPAIYRKLAAS